MAIDPRIPTMPGRSTSGFRQPGRRGRRGGGRRVYGSVCPFDMGMAVLGRIITEESLLFPTCRHEKRYFSFEMSEKEKPKPGMPYFALMLVIVL